MGTEEDLDVPVVFPEREVVELENVNPIFHTVYDLDERYQVASQGSVRRGTSWKCDGCPDHWRDAGSKNGSRRVGSISAADHFDRQGRKGPLCGQRWFSDPDRLAANNAGW